jgi:hypothetical protein
VGRITGGNVDDLSASQVRTLLNVADGAAACSDTAYAASWDGVTDVAPSKNAVYDEMELRAPKASPTISGLLTLSGGQIKFPASQSASSDVNTLDDYEEGTWTPAYTPATGSFKTMTATVGGTYVKIGKAIFVTGFIMTQNVDVTGASGSLYITGLPFTPTVNYAFTIGYAINWTNHPIKLYTFNNAATIQLFKRASTTGADTAVQVSDLSTGANTNYNRIFFSGIYFV